MTWETKHLSNKVSSKHDLLETKRTILQQQESCNRTIRFVVGFAKWSTIETQRSGVTGQNKPKNWQFFRWVKASPPRHVYIISKRSGRPRLANCKGPPGLDFYGLLSLLRLEKKQTSNCYLTFQWSKRNVSSPFNQGVKKNDWTCWRKWRMSSFAPCEQIHADREKF